MGQGELGVVIRPRPDASLSAQFTEVARARPDAVAVIHRSEQLSYAELDRRSAALAGKITIATEPGEFVGICLPPGIDAIVAIVAAAKSRRAYVPLDPGYPEDRLRYIAEDAGLAAIVVGAGTPDAVGRYATPIDARVTGVQPVELPEASSTTPAYVIYTSGSTGHPKGVLVSHGNVAALLAATASLFEFDAGDTWSLFHSISFDFSVWEVWGSLLYGARLVVVDEETRMSPDRLLTLLENEHITVFNVVPSIFREIVTEFARRPRTLDLRYLIFGGEPVHLPSVAEFRAASACRPRIVNMYGITETTVHVTARFLEPGDEHTAGGSPIGTPLPHLDVVLVDTDLSPVPDGTVGELCVTGAGVAIGYLRRPELTAERFVRLDYAGAARRFYRSGDLVRWNSQGELEYHGRADHQVKVRGFRIELGEIEARIESMSEVAAAAAVVSRNRSGDPILRAYFIPRVGVGDDDGRKLARRLRAALHQVLPAHMVPGRLVPVASLPRTPSGKLDRTRLAAGG